MTLQLPSDFLTELLKLEREQRKVVDLAKTWDLDISCDESDYKDLIQQSVREAAGK